jgi:hypothetical protein
MSPAVCAGRVTASSLKRPQVISGTSRLTQLVVRGTKRNATEFMQ